MRSFLLHFWSPEVKISKLGLKPVSRSLEGLTCLLMGSLKIEIRNKTI